MAIKKRERRCLRRVLEAVRHTFDQVLSRIGDVENDVARQAASIDEIGAAIKKLRDEDKKRIWEELARHQKDIVAISRERDRFVEDARRGLLKLHEQVDSKITEFYKCIDMVNGKRDLDYMTVDEYLLLIEPSRRGPIADESRQQHEAQLDALMRENGMQPGMVRAPFEKVHRTYPRDLIIDHFNGEDQRPWSAPAR